MPHVTHHRRQAFAESRSMSFMAVETRHMYLTSRLKASDGATGVSKAQV
ncbi:hypothetical protein [Burkholderia multivorans]|nr:hypothetical protein [Burkholderia multivorans]